MRALNLVATFSLLLSVAPAAEPVRITFLPPPLEGTLSVGVYSLSGQLVRTLHSDTTTDAFTVGLNGLITTWDGRDNAGTPAPRGNYFVRGYTVGNLKIEGTAFLGNDWYEENGPVVCDFTAMRLNGRTLEVDAALADDQHKVIVLDLETGAVSYAAAEGDRPAATREAAGQQGTVWKLENDGVVQYEGMTELRQLPVTESDPRPFSIVSARDRDEIYLLERDAKVLQLRGLRLKKQAVEADGKAVSEWEICLQKRIVAQGSFAEVSSALNLPAPVGSTDALRVGLMRNELLEVAPAAVIVTVGVDEKGSFLRTLDGLPLRRLTDTPRLKWATLIRKADGTAALFQSNGALTEEYHLQQLERMMAFDAGDYEWTGGR